MRKKMKNTTILKMKFSNHFMTQTHHHLYESLGFHNAEIPGLDFVDFPQCRSKHDPLLTYTIMHYDFLALIYIYTHIPFKLHGSIYLIFIISFHHLIILDW